MSKEDRIRAELFSQLERFDAPTGPWILSLSRVSAANAENISKAVAQWCEANDVIHPLIVFGQLNKLTVADAELMRQSGWVRIDG